MWSTIQRYDSSGPRTRRTILGLGAAAVALLASVAPLTACGGEVTCTATEKQFGNLCVEAEIDRFKDCTSDVATTLTEEQRGRIEVQVGSAIRAVGGKGAVEFANALVRETSDAVNIRVIETCFALAQQSAATAPEVKVGYENARQEIQKKAPESPSVTLRPASGKLPTKITVAGAHWPPNARLKVTASGGTAHDAESDADGDFRLPNVQLDQGARIAGENHATVTVQTPDPANPSSGIVKIAVFQITGSPSSSTTPASTTKPTTTTTTKPTKATTKPSG